MQNYFEGIELPQIKKGNKQNLRQEANNNCGSIAMVLLGLSRFVQYYFQLMTILKKVRQIN